MNILVKSSLGILWADIIGTIAGTLIALLVYISIVMVSREDAFINYLTIFAFVTLGFLLYRILFSIHYYIRESKETLECHENVFKINDLPYKPIYLIENKNICIADKEDFYYFIFQSGTTTKCFSSLTIEPELKEYILNNNHITVKSKFFPIIKMH